MILSQQKIIARDQNRVFVEAAAYRRLSGAAAVEKYGLSPGKAMAYVEFYIDRDRLESSFNRRLQITELSVIGHVDLTGREPEGFYNL